MMLQPETIMVFHFSDVMTPKYLPHQVSQLLIVEIQQLKGVNLWKKEERRTQDQKITADPILPEATAPPIVKVSVRLMHATTERGITEHP